VPNERGVTKPILRIGEWHLHCRTPAMWLLDSHLRVSFFFKKRRDHRARETCVLYIYFHSTGR